MAIYFFDKNQTLIKIVPESATFEAIQTQELDDDSLLKDTFSVTVKGDENLIDAEYMAVKSYRGNAQTFDMYRIVTDTTPNKTMSFTGMSLAPYELNGHIIQDLRPANHSLEYTLNRVLTGTDWRLGYVDDGLSNVTTTFYYVSAKEALKELQSLVGCEFVFKVEISGQKITDKWIEVYNELGNRTKKRFNYGTNALTVVRETNKADIYTALIGRGKGEEVSSAEENESGQAGYGRKITFEDIEWSTANGNPLNKPIGQYYLELPQATQVYGIKNIDGTMSARVGIVDFDDEEDKNRLINLTYQQLLVSSRPKVLFKTTVANIGATGIGDTVTIHRHDLNIHYQTRVRKIVRNKLNDNKTQIELGDAVVTPSTKQTKQNNATIKNLNNEIDKIKANVTTSQNSADGKNTIFYGSAEPERQRTGDTWYRPHPSIAGETQMLTWNGTAWELVIDTSDLTSVSREVKDAISKAEEAKELAVSEAKSALAQAKSDATTKANAIKEQITGEVNTAITTAEDAKQTAIDGYNNAVAESERLVGEQTAAFDTKFGEIEDDVNAFNQSVADVDAKADDALKKAGANANLLTTYQNAIDTINTVTLPDISSSVGDALASAKDAMDEAKKADDKIADFVTQNGLVSGTVVDSKIDEATGAISKKITAVEGKIPTTIGGRNLIVRNTLQVGYYISATGTIVRSASSANITTDWVDISGAKELTFTTYDKFEGAFTGRVALYSDKSESNFISIPVSYNSTSPIQSYTFDVPENAKYARVSVIYGDTLRYKFERGNVPTDWTPAPEDNYTQEEFAIFESTYNEDVKGINSTLTELTNKKLDGTTYTDFYNNEYKKTAQGVTDTWEAVNKIVDENGNTTDTFAKAVYDQNATRRTEDFDEITKDLVKEATYTAGINGLSGSISTISGQIDKLKAGGGGRNYALKSNVYYYTTDYKVSEYDLSKIPKGTKIKISIWGGLGTSARTFGAYINNGNGTTSGNSQIIELTKLEGVFGQGVAVPLAKWTGEATLNVDASKILIFGLDSNYSAPKRIEYVKVETGETFTDWTIAPEDMLGKADFQVFKTTYEANDKTIKARLLAVDSGKEGSIAYRLNETESTANGNTKSILSVRGDLDSLSGGGNNYAVDTSNKMKYYLQIQTYSGLLDQDNKLTSKAKYTLNELDAKVGDWYTASVYIGQSGGFGSNITVYNQSTRSVRARGNKAGQGYSSVTFQVLEGDTEFNFYLGNESGNGTNYQIEAKEFQIEKGKIRTAWKPAISEQMGKAEFTLFKNDYEETAKEVKRRLTAIDSNEDGSFLTRLNATESTASGNSGLIATVKSTADGAVQSNSLEYQKLTETSEIHQRVIGSEGVLTYTKNRRLGAKSQEIPQGHTAKIEHNGDGFEIGKTYTLSFNASCLSEDVVKWLERSRTETIPFKRVVKEDNTIFEKDSYIERNGVNGNATYTWTVETINGVETGNRTDEARTGRLDPVDEIYVKGTKTSSVVNFTIKKSLQDLSDAKVVMLGDSITMGYGRTTKIPDVIKSELGAQSVQNAGYGSTTAALHPNKPELRKIGFTKLVDSIISGSWSEALNADLSGISYATPQTYKQSLTNLSNTNFNNVDAVIIMYGTNDWAMDVKLDNSSNRYDQSTYLGALRYGINKLQQAYPNLEILVAQPILWTMGSITSEGYNNGIGLKVRDYANGLNNSLGVSIPVAQTYNKGITTSNYTNYFNTGDSSDGTHPNSAGNTAIGNLIASEFERLIDISPAPQTTSTVNFKINKGG